MKAGVRWACAIAIAVSAVAVGGPAFARTSSKLDQSVVVRAPANASAASGSFFDSVSCPTARFCAAGGGYRNKANRTKAMVAQSVNGRWARATKCGCRHDLRRSPRGSIRSTAPGRATVSRCGGYWNGRIARGLIAVETSGRWHRAMVPSPPTNSSLGRPSAELTAVSCPAPGSCLAAGGYVSRTGHDLLMEVTESHGRWGRARTLPLPASSGPSFDAAVLALSCPALGSCVAGGQFDTRSGNVAPMVISQSAGRWHAAATGLPADATDFYDARIASISCPSTGNCLAVGTYCITAG